MLDYLVWFLLCFFSGSGEGSPLVELFGVYGGADIGFTIGMSVGKRYGELEGYTLGEWTFDSEARS